MGGSKLTNPDHNICQIVKDACKSANPFFFKCDHISNFLVKDSGIKFRKYSSVC